MSTHDKIMIDCIQTKKLYDLFEENKSLLEPQVHLL